MSRFDLGSSTLNDAFETLRADYDISKQTRFRRTRAGVSSVGKHADYHFRTDAQFYRAMELSRDIDRNDIVIGQAVDRLIDNVIQDGFTLDTQVEPLSNEQRQDGKRRRSSLDDDLLARWKEWSANEDACDLAGESDFHTLERMTLRHTIVDGDILHLPIASTGSLETCEAHRCKTPTNTTRDVVLGVMLEEATRKRLEYWMTREDVGITTAVSKVGDIRRYPARQRDPITGRDERTVIHCYHPRRVSQTRGFTAFAPIAMATEHHDDLQFAQLVKARIAASYTILENVPLAAPGGARRSPTGSQSTETLSDGSERHLEGIGPGMTKRSSPGGTLTGFSPHVPNQEFFEHSMLILTFISINLGLPVQLLLLDPRNTNFSGWRGAMDQARLGFRNLQRWLSRSFHSRVYRWKVRQWISEDRILQAEYDRIGEQLFRHRWNPPRWPYIQPMEDASAGILRVRNLQTSPRRLAAENGHDWWEISEETIQDNTEVIDAALSREKTLREKYPESPNPPSWREVLCLPTPDQVGGQVAPPAQEQTTQPEMVNEQI